MEKLNLIKKIIDDWENGKLSDGDALVAIETVIYPRYEPTQADIERAQAISSSIAAALLQKSLKGGKSIKIPSLNIEIAPPDESETTDD